MSEKGLLFSQIFKPIATARRQMKMKRIACTTEGVKLVASIDIRGRAEVLFFKTTKNLILFPESPQVSMIQCRLTTI